jgi:hypothetical protein
MSDEMEREVRRMPDEQLRSELERMNRIGDPTVGNEEYRKALEKEFGRRISGMP